MPNGLSHAEIEERLPAFVLGAMEADEMLAMHQALQQHRDLLAHLHAYEQVAAQLSHAAPDQPLPADGKGRLLARVRAERVAEARPVVPAARTQTRRLAPAWNWTGNRAWTGALAALLLVALLGTFRAQQGAARERAALQAQIVQLQAANERLEEAQAAQTVQLARLAHSTRAVALGSTDAAPDATATLFVDGDEGLMLVQGLDALPAAQQYQLWLLPAEGDPAPAGVFTVTQSASVLIPVALPDDALRAPGFAVSVEPAGGSPAPTGPIVLLGTQG